MALTITLVCTFAVILISQVAVAEPVIAGASSSAGSFASSSAGIGQYGGEGFPLIPIQQIPAETFNNGQLQARLNEQFAAQHAAIQKSLEQALQQAQANAGYGNAQGVFNSYQPQPSGSPFPPYQYGSGGSDPVSALAAASIGPSGGFQSVQLSPPNPNSPNVLNRFGSEGGTQPGGAYSVFTSSVSGSRDINGKKTSFRKAQTTINDNGKISTYSVQDP
uniref:Putative conserved secreted protein n=1 Tax=Xenopsylla cheopis TaxID=163159 RepID=A0A6M2E3Z0_XENCH